MIVSIITNADKTIGLGHLSRCCAIAEELKNIGVMTNFIVASNFIDDLGLVKNFSVIKLGCLFQSNEAIDAIRSNINNDVKLVLFDTYSFTQDDYRAFAKKTHVPLACICDDENEDDVFDIIFKPRLSSSSQNLYSKLKNAKPLVFEGPSFLVFRQNLIENQKTRINESIKNVLITTGSTDYRHLIYHWAMDLADEYQDFIINVLIGPAFADFHLYQNTLKSYPNINLIATHQETAKKNSIIFVEYKELIYQTDIVISSAGVSATEFLFLDVPMIVGAIVENQFNNIKIIEEKSLALVFDVFSKPSLLYQFNEIQNAAFRHKLSHRYKNFIDGLGSLRIASIIKEYINESL